MTIDYQPTPEEEAYERLLEEKGEMFSEAAHTILQEAWTVSHRMFLIPSYAFQGEEYSEAMHNMRLAATGLTDRERELLAEIVDAMYVVAVSIDPEDKTPVGHRVYRRDLRSHYETAASMVEEILQEETEER